MNLSGVLTAVVDLVAALHRTVLLLLLTMGARCARACCMTQERTWISSGEEMRDNAG